MKTGDTSLLQSKLNETNSELLNIETELQSPDTIKNQEKYKQINRKYSELSEIKTTIDRILKLQKQLNDNKELLISENDQEMVNLINKENEDIESELITAEDKYLDLTSLKDPHDHGNAILEIRAGTGGEEASLFAHEIYRAYLKYAENLGFSVELADISQSATGGFKEAIFFINGENAYKNFKYESGVHRVQRVPATEASGRIHTSAISVVVLPEIEETEVEIDPGDLRIDVYRSGGPGGQSVNTTDSAVRIVHKPTGIIVTCQDEKSQHKNKAKAMKILQAKLYDIAKAEADKKLGNIRQDAIKSGDRSAKIRTYNFPQSRVTDHRIHQSWHNLGEIMEGNFNEITLALSKYKPDNNTTENDNLSDS